MKTLLHKTFKGQGSFKDSSSKAEISLYFMLKLTHSCVRVSLESVGCIYDTFDNNLEIKNNFAKYLWESLFDKRFFFNYALK